MGTGGVCVVLCCVVLCCVVLRSVVLCCVLFCRVVLWYVVLCGDLVCCVVWGFVVLRPSLPIPRLFLFGSPYSTGGRVRGGRGVGEVGSGKAVRVPVTGCWKLLQPAPSRDKPGDTPDMGLRFPPGARQGEPLAGY